MLPKTIPVAETIHHRPIAPRWASCACKAEAVGEPRNYSFTWTDVNCPKCVAWFREREIRLLSERIPRLERLIGEKTRLLAELRVRLDEKEAIAREGS